MPMSKPAKTAAKAAKAVKPVAPRPKRRKASDRNADTDTDTGTVSSTSVVSKSPPKRRRRNMKSHYCYTSKTIVSKKQQLEENYVSTLPKESETQIKYNSEKTID